MFAPPMIRSTLSAVVTAVGLLASATTASAHPHVWITMTGEVVYAPDGSITGVRYAWTFDDMFSTFATQGLESKQKGVFTRDELQPLAKVNVEEYHLEFSNSLLTLHFLLPFKAPVKAKSLDLQVFDPSYYVDFAFDDKAQPPAKLVGAPAQCKLTIGKPQEMDAKLAQQLSQLPPTVRNPTALIGAEYSNRISIRCQ
jgi:ABC-type uncharacterized transport system substrate-binding protein